VRATGTALAGGDDGADAQLLGWLPYCARFGRILAGPGQPAARSAAIPPRWRALAGGTPVTLTRRYPTMSPLANTIRLEGGSVTAYGLIDTTEMYLRTLFELEEEGIPPLRAR